LIQHFAGAGRLYFSASTFESKRIGFATWGMADVDSFPQPFRGADVATYEMTGSGYAIANSQSPIPNADNRWPMPMADGQ
jgi:hypothetical protein